MKMKTPMLEPSNWQKAYLRIMTTTSSARKSKTKLKMD